MGAFGEKLRKQREQRGLALDAISNTTKISTRMLRALEEEHFDQLPGGVFNKGFVRAYARQVGLDEEEAITDYLTALRESQEQSQKILPDFRNQAGKPRSVPDSDLQRDGLSSGNYSSTGKGRPDVSTAERRRDDERSEERRVEERRNEVRRKDDRGPRNPPPLVAAASTNRPTEIDRDGKNDREEAIRERNPRHQDPPPAAQARDHHSEKHFNETRYGGERAGKEHPHYDNSSMPGFITLGASAEDSGESSNASSTRHSAARKLGAALILLTVGLTSWLYHRHQESVANSAVSSNPSSAVPTAHSAAPTVAPASAPATKTAPAEAESKASRGRSSVRPAPAAAKLSAMPGTPKPAASSGSDTLSAATSKPATAKPPTTFSLTIRADQTTWISITADGKPVVHETLIAPAHTSVRAARDIAVKVGNAAGVSFLLDGKEFPAQGNSGEVKTYLFDATGLKPAPSPSTTTTQ